MEVKLELLHASSVENERSATKSVVVCVYKCQNVVKTRQPWNSAKVRDGSPKARSEPQMFFSYVKHFINIIVNNFESSHTDSCFSKYTSLPYLSMNI